MAKKPTPVTAPKLPAAFQGATPQSISRDEIYHRLEWYLNVSHDPTGPHLIPPGASITPFLKNITLTTFWQNINNHSSLYVPAWQSPLFNGVKFPLNSGPGAVGILNVKTMEDLIECAVDSYKHAGWQVT